MVRVSPLLVILTLALLGLSGCIGGDDAPATDDDDTERAEEARATEEFGAITGQVLDTNLEPVVNGDVFLVKRGEQERATRTDKDGRYTFNEVAPGVYTIQVSAAGYGAGSKNVDVRANEISDASLQVDKLSDVELGLPYIDDRVFEGFLACGAGQAIIPRGTPGAEEGVNPRTSPCGSIDENDEFLFDFVLEKGLQEIVIGMTWDPAGGVSGTELNLNMEIGGCDVTCTDPETYVEASGPPDMLIQLREEDIPTELAFSAMNESKAVQFRIFPAATQTPNVIYQQPYTIYVELYYNQFAEEGRNPIPDQ